MRVAALAAAAAAADPPLAHLTFGTAVGRTVAADTGAPVSAFLGIPYAKPPVGDLRWRSPVEKVEVRTPFNATEYAPCCIQAPVNPGVRAVAADADTSEDCLYINAFTPTRNATAGLPVSVFIHGGSFQEGCSNSRWYGEQGSANFAGRTGSVLFTINYRLNAFGFLGLKEQVAAGAVNWGLLDQQAALRFVRDNAASFGGDPSKVMIFGQSAGGASVSFHLIMKGSAPLFRAALMESPGGRKSWVQDLHEADQDALTEAEILRNSDAFAEKRGCGGGDRVECLRKLTVAQILAKPLGRLAPAVDGHEVTAIPLDAIEAGDWHRVPVVVGGNSCESCAEAVPFIGPQRNVTDEEYRSALNKTFGAQRFLRPVPLSPAEVEGWYAEYAAERGNWLSYARIASDDGHACGAHLIAAALRDTAPPGSVWRYEFRHSDTYPGAPHAAELPYVFGAGNQTPFTEAEAALSRLMTDAWGRFARTGNPSGAVGWPAYVVGGNETMAFDLRSGVVRESENDDGSFGRHCPLWRQFNV
eukprot:TRINITY_DN4213_c0_g1_i1.p1 TRINITY_DN4213_c0_g1~~TRINITY_DN4213_c0_g1_i1.p1  ORF type:complete len:529 (+),score=141.09 TRINITY_DN4213_c0_g1_i1:91-1677(+)